MEKFLRLSTVAMMLEISPRTLGNWIRKGQGPRFKVSPGARYLFRTSDVLEWLSKLGGSPDIENSTKEMP